MFVLFFDVYIFVLIVSAGYASVQVRQPAIPPEKNLRIAIYTSVIS